MTVGQTNGHKGTALIYCRVSTRKQEDEGTSLETQEEACVKHAEHLGYSVFRIYREAYSGHELFDRPILSTLREEVRTGKHAAVIVYCTDRFSRKQGITFVLLHEWEPYGAALISVTDPLDKTPQGKFMLSAREFVAEVEREKIRERTMRGKRARVRGTEKDDPKVQNWGFPPYGYRLNEPGDAREIFEPEATVVRRIFRMCGEEGLGLVAIAKQLNRERVPSPGTGKYARRGSDWEPHWGSTQVRRILDRTDYKGVAFALLHAVASEDGEKVAPVLLPATASPALIATELWDAAHVQLADHRGVYRRADSAPHLLTGFIFCAECGRRIYFERHAGRHAEEYRCSSRVTYEGRCSGTPARADDAIPRNNMPRRSDGKVRRTDDDERAEVATIPGIERAVWQYIAELLEEPETIKRELDRQRQEKRHGAYDDDLAVARRALVKLDQQQAKLVRRFSEASGDDFPWDLVEREVSRLEREKKHIQDSIGELESRIAVEQRTIDQSATLAEYLERVKRNLKTFDLEEKRLALKALGVKVFASGRKWELEWRPGIRVQLPGNRSYLHKAR